MTSARDLRNWAEKELSAVTADPGLDALILMSEATGLSRTHVLFRDSLEIEEEELFRSWIARRKNHEPIQYITTRAYFRNLTLEVGPGVLIPRPESEELVSAIKRAVTNLPYPKVLDLGAGSGALSIAIATELPGADVTALEKDSAAAHWLKRNIDTSEVDVEVQVSDVQSFNSSTLFDAVVANPPYIPSGQSLPAEVMNFEPHVALFGGSDGLVILREFIGAAARVLKSGGYLAIEHYETQGTEVASLMADTFSEVTLHYDLNQRPRFSSGVRK